VLPNPVIWDLFTWVELDDLIFRIIGDSRTVLLGLILDDVLYEVSGLLNRMDLVLERIDSSTSPLPHEVVWHFIILV